MGEVITVAVQKGGAGKSSLSNAISYAYRNKNKSTILVDFDPQASQTESFMGFKYGSFTGDDPSNIINMFYEKEVVPIKIETIKHIENPNKGKMHQPHYLTEEMTIDFIPSNHELLDIIEENEFSVVEKIDLIKKFIRTLAEKYDKVILDAPPSFGIITTAIVQSSNVILLPVTTKSVDAAGMTGFLGHLNKKLNNQETFLSKIVIVPNMFDKRTSDAKTTLLDIKRIPNGVKQLQNLREIECKISEEFPIRSAIQEAPGYSMFAAPYIMEYSRSHNSDIILKIESLVKLLD